MPFYQAVADAYDKAHPEVGFTCFSTLLREAERKRSAALPTGTGLDILDSGAEISVNCIAAGLIKPNEATIDQDLRSRTWNKLAVDFFTMAGKSEGRPPAEVSQASMYYNKAMFAKAGIASSPSTFPGLVDVARKLTEIDASGRMTRSGISLRLSGQGSGIIEKFRYALEAAGDSANVKSASGKHRNGFENDAGLPLYVDAVQNDKIDGPKIQHDADALVAGNMAMLYREAWVVFIWPLLVANDQLLFDMEIGEFRSSNDDRELMAASVISTLPMLLTFLILRRRIVESVAPTGLQG